MTIGYFRRGLIRLSDVSNCDSTIWMMTVSVSQSHPRAHDHRSPDCGQESGRATWGGKRVCLTCELTAGTQCRTVGPHIGPVRVKSPSLKSPQRGQGEFGARPSSGRDPRLPTGGSGTTTTRSGIASA